MLFSPHPPHGTACLFRAASRVGRPRFECAANEVATSITSLITRVILAPTRPQGISVASDTLP